MKLTKARGIEKVVVALVSTMKAAVGLDETGLHTVPGTEEGLHAATRAATTALARIVVMLVGTATTISLATAATDARATGTKNKFTQAGGVEE